MMLVPDRPPYPGVAGSRTLSYSARRASCFAKQASQGFFLCVFVLVRHNGGAAWAVDYRLLAAIFVAGV